MVDPVAMPSFPTLLQRFFSEHLGQHRAVSPRTIAAYRDTFRLLLQFAEETIGKSPTTISLADLNMKLILGFLDYLEKQRNNSVRSRNARLAALQYLLKYTSASRPYRASGNRAGFGRPDEEIRKADARVSHPSRDAGHS